MHSRPHPLLPLLLLVLAITTPTLATDLFPSSLIGVPSILPNPTDLIPIPTNLIPNPIKIISPVLPKPFAGAAAAMTPEVRTDADTQLESGAPAGEAALGSAA
ncbi:hypothetical protein P167DRAFT_580493 [Morchella conica CCBAS932]|uniref:Uncharacterized protein n=1 Tax=Morchella conica CCBAS932 TaxID=1392247 RepID=A0A3N4K7D1_9PEZI|nr:hypothetical protein P167DRAFT_580493 [Morchella conica CCBAS932]